ncbi:MAG: acetyl transferase [Deltaproteobacteria bacterium]|nr:acetyl transferase [Deltaproteobacteria bacterium]
MKRKIILIGGGGHCKSCIDVIEGDNRFTIAGIIDIPEKVGQTVLDYKIIGSEDDLKEIVKTHKLYLITIGQIKGPDIRIEKYEQIARIGGKFPVVISPKAYVSKHASIGDGTIIMHGAIINAGASIGRNCIINTGAVIEHDVIIGDHCHISTGATINGGTVVKQGSFLGSNAVTKEYITIGEKSFIKANSLVKVSNE